MVETAINYDNLNQFFLFAVKAMPSPPQQIGSFVMKRKIMFVFFFKVQSCKAWPNVWHSQEPTEDEFMFLFLKRQFEILGNTLI